MNFNMKDLEYLSDGLEGRSNNPVALLYDKLKHPDGDLGLEKTSCLTWNYDPLKEIDHIVIGKAPGPGGAWNDLDGSQLTISPSRWMELPDMSFYDWERRSKILSNMNAGLVFSSTDSNFSEDNSLLNANLVTNKSHQNTVSLQPITTEESRSTMHDVRNYYSDYVKQKNLDKYLLNNATVTNVRRFNCYSKLINQSDEQSNGARNFWEVSGLIDKRDRKKASSLTHKDDLIEFRFVCKHLVLACGVNDLHKDLRVKGENSRFVLKSIRELEEKIRDDLPRLRKDPLLIVGSGLSAADAILLAQKYYIKIIHVIRRPVTDQDLIFSKLPKKSYPEYQRVYEKMIKNRYTNYHSNLTSSKNVISKNLSMGNQNQEDTSKLRRPLSQSDLNSGLTQQKSNLNDLNEKFSENSMPYYVLYDEHRIKCFTSKRTCILIKSNLNSSFSNNTLSAPINNSNSTSNRYLLKQNHQFNQRQLNEFDEELEQPNENSNKINNSNNKKTSLNFEETEIKISYACVLIGYSPDLDFLPPYILNDLAVNPSKILNTKDNPIQIDLYTHECAKFKTLYAMGPLIGDNFVRFGTGGALAITSRIVDYMRKEKETSRNSNNKSNIRITILNEIKKKDNEAAINT